MNNMKCDNNHEMTQEEVLVHRTTSPLEDDEYQTMWWCEACQDAQPLEEEDYES